MIQKIFADVFGAEPIIVRSPVPARLMGEYNPNNDGCLLTTTINKWVQVAVSKRTDARIQLFSVRHMEKIELLPTDMIGVSKTSWINPVFSAVYQFYLGGHHLQGMNIMLDAGDPAAGIPYAVALETALYVAFNELFGLQLTGETLMHIASTAFEPDFYTCLFGRKDYALQLDTRTGKHEYIPLRLGDYSMALFVLGNRSATPADIARNRLSVCEDVVRELKKVDPAIQSIRDIPLPLLYTHIKRPSIRRRAAFIIRENTRVVAAATNLKAGNLKAFGQKLTESDEGLVKEYETGSPGADWLMDELEWNQQVIGARRLTGSFRNAALAFVRNTELEEVTSNIQNAYEKKMEKRLSVHLVATVHGTEVAKDNSSQYTT